jgi:ABC-type dipeptide/oligopeptide/nickel transport system ATPase component
VTDTQTSAPLSIRDLNVQYPTDEEVVRALDGIL